MGCRDVAEIVARSEWRWNDETPIVHETTTIRAYPATKGGRLIDLQFEMTAIKEGVTLARRGTKLYGGLNARLAPVSQLKTAHHDDGPEANPRTAWQYATGTWKGASKPATFVIFEHADNPGYPGDYIEYPNLPWFQPTFPKAGTRHLLSKDKPLVLRYRFWIVDADVPEANALRDQWTEYNTPEPSSTTTN